MDKMWSREDSAWEGLVKFLSMTYYNAYNYVNFDAGAGEENGTETNVKEVFSLFGTLTIVLYIR